MFILKTSTPKLLTATQLKAFNLFSKDEQGQFLLWFLFL
ncbi:hypothetical protein EDD58_103146 [Hazenella coriacea]|uniref:Uncharacterized protein n=1 Tax=Hazenella coriacea TaxID=1179467 RepID=A0A4R3L535_9BACL|nr:hypothetical protein EDD58_103146 [Hazenella coriacea]